MARVGEGVVGLDEDRLPGRVAVGVLTRVFPPALVDEVVAGAGVVEQRIRVLPARLVVYCTLAMILFFQSSYSQVWVKLVGGLDWARSFRARVAVGMSPSPAAISKARARLGWQVMADLLERVAGPLAGQDDGWAYVAGLRLVAVDGLTVDVPDTATRRRPATYAHPSSCPANGPATRSNRSAITCHPNRARALAIAAGDGDIPTATRARNDLAQSSPPTSLTHTWE